MPVGRFTHDGSSRQSALLDQGLRRWQAVVAALGAEPDDSRQKYFQCPVHNGDNPTAFSVGIGDSGWPVFTCYTGCADEIDDDRKAWYAKARPVLVAAGVPDTALAPVSGRQGAQAVTTTPSVPRASKRPPPPVPLPTEGSLRKWSLRLRKAEQAQGLLAFLSEERLLRRKTIKKAGLGAHYGRITVPIRTASGELVNVRHYKPHAKISKVHSETGHGESVLYPIAALARDDAGPVLLCEGEIDALVAGQHGFVAVSGTGGAGNPPKDLTALAERPVYVAYDCDAAGRTGAMKVAARLVSVAKEVFVLDLGLRDGEDISDWFVTHGKSADDLRALMATASAFDPKGDVEDILWLSAVEQRRISWLWAGRIPMGKLTMLEGDPGLGKSTLWVDWAARVTMGTPFPGDLYERPPGTVLVVAGEDDLNDTIVPRLQAAGADLSRVASVQLQRDDEGHLVPLTLPEDLRRIRRLIRQNRITLLVIDPVMAFMSEGINTNNDASVRRALTPLVEVLQETGAAGLLVRHLNKSGELQALYRGGGSIAFIGVARSGLVVVKHPEDPGLVVLAQTKQNLARDQTALTYRVAKLTDDDGLADTYISYGEELDLTADELLRKPDGRRTSPEREDAVRWLRDVLADGPVPVEQLRATAKDAGLSWRTIERAKSQIAVVHSVREAGDDGRVLRWVWILDAPRPGVSGGGT